VCYINNRREVVRTLTLDEVGFVSSGDGEPIEEVTVTTS
jgi:hypothetical protein